MISSLYVCKYGTCAGGAVIDADLQLFQKTREAISTSYSTITSYRMVASPCRKGLFSQGDWTRPLETVSAWLASSTAKPKGSDNSLAGRILLFRGPPPHPFLASFIHGLHLPHGLDYWYVV